MITKATQSGNGHDRTEPDGDQHDFLKMRRILSDDLSALLPSDRAGGAETTSKPTLREKR